MSTDLEGTELIVCPACEEAGGHSFYAVDDVPVHSVQLVQSEVEAKAFPTHRIDLVHCPHCGFIFNHYYDPDRQSYDEDYEETQGFSETFQAFHRELAESLVTRHDLRGRRILEIGCGKGEFISLLCELGDNHGVAYDPAYRPERNASPARNRIQFVRTFFPPTAIEEVTDFVCCKMTLEHVGQPLEFMRTVRRSLGQQTEALAFFQIPDARRVFKDAAYWDIYYEHCSYFTAGSLGRLFRRAGFAVERIWTGYADQYLMIEARPVDGASSPHPAEEALRDLSQEVAAFGQRLKDQQRAWRGVFETAREKGRRGVIWGGGSKAVAFLCAMTGSNEILGAVDINPHKHGTFLAGVGTPIIAPAELVDLRPDFVVVMNPIYIEEISQALRGLGCYPTLYSIEAPERPLSV